MLSQFGPDLLVQCANTTKLSHDLVHKWLEKYMFHGKEDAAKRAAVIADWLADHNAFKSHSRHIPRHDLEAKGMDIVYLEKDAEEQDDLLSIFHAVSHTFTNTAAVKIIENHKGNAFVNQIQKMMMMKGPPPKGPGGAGPGGGGGGKPPEVPSGAQPPFKKKLPF